LVQILRDLWLWLFNKLKKRSTYLVLFSILLFCIGISKLINQQTAAAGLSLTCGFFALIFASLDEFEYFEWLGLKAKMRNTVRDAEIIMGELRKISCIVATVSMDLLSKTGRMDSSFYSVERIALKDKLVDSLSSMGVQQAEMEGILDTFNRYILIDIGRAVLSVSKNKYNDVISKESNGVARDDAVKERDDLSKEWNALALVEEGATDIFVKSFISKAKEMISASKIFEGKLEKRIISEIDEYQLDFEHYQKTGQSRRPEIWKRDGV